MSYDFKGFDIIVVASAFFLYGREFYIEGAIVFIVGSLLSGGVGEFYRRKKPS